MCLSTYQLIQQSFLTNAFGQKNYTCELTLGYDMYLLVVLYVAVLYAETTMKYKQVALRST